MKIEVRAMFFNAKMDYLPYYKSFKLSVDENANIKKVCELIKEKDFNYDYPTENFYLKVNDKIVSSFVKVKDLVDIFGDEFTIEPVSKFRVINDLIIDDSDFYNSFEILKDFAKKEDLQLYKSLYDVYYGSESFKYESDYIGDAVLIVAYNIIKRDEKDKDAILKAISEDICGLWCCEYENNILFSKDYSGVIEELKNMAKKPEISLLNKICSNFTKKAKAPKVDSLKDVNVAIYYGKNFDENIEKNLKKFGANIIEFSKSRKLAGQSLIDVNPTLAYKKGGTVLLDAMDNSAEILVTLKNEDANYFRENFGNFERAVGREIYLEIISIEELLKSLQNIKEEI